MVMAIFNLNCLLRCSNEDVKEEAIVCLDIIEDWACDTIFDWIWNCLGIEYTDH